MVVGVAVVGSCHCLAGRGVDCALVVGLVENTGAILLDAEAPMELRERIRQRLESLPETKVLDLHLWSVGQGSWTLVASVVSHHDASPNQYKAALADMDGLHHPIIEVHLCHCCEESQA